MPVYLELQKTTSERSVFINVNHLVMVSYGSSKDTTTIEFVGQRTLEVRGSVEDIMSKLNNFSGEGAAV
ncbi:hypothetical protein [Hoeflea poritis]|uniref:Flagellar protein FlbD n=1 Tax=Hoeflea poritis TaxID=2993659 RepID=A0ABT4VVY6_9HYPH|nr:hypothetical protein [Hoeflea poritis]MDA4848866.1 hypothetical protein [Hoeflea poritis]